MEYQMIKFDDVKTFLEEIDCDIKKAKEEFNKRINKKLFYGPKSAFGDVARYNGSPLSYAAKVIAGIDPDKQD